MVMVQCTGEGGTKEEGGADEEGGACSSPAASSIETLSSSANYGGHLLFWSSVSSSQRALAREESMVGVVQRGNGGG